MLTEQEIKTIKKYVTPTLGRRKANPDRINETADYTHLLQVAEATRHAYATDMYMLSTWRLPTSKIEAPEDCFTMLKGEDTFKPNPSSQGATIHNMFNKQKEKLEASNMTALVHVPTFKKQLRDSQHICRHRQGLDYIGLKYEKRETAHPNGITGNVLICAPNLRDGAWGENVKTFQLQRLQSLLARAGSTYARLSFGESFTSPLLIESTNRWNSRWGGQIFSHLLMPCRYA